MGRYDPSTQTKLCSKCKTRKPVSEFNKQENHGADPYQSKCKSCAAADYATWAAKNAAHKSAYMVRWYRDNIARVKIYDKIRWSNPEHQARERARRELRREYLRAWYRLYVAKNRPRIRAQQAAWARRNPEKVAARYHRRRAMLVSAEGGWTAADIRRIGRLQKWKCAICRRSVKDGYDIDHIIALSRGGTNYPRNLQLLCGPCNRHKHNKDPLEHMRALGRLL